MWLASHWENKVEDAAKTYPASTNKGTRPYVLIMRALATNPSKMAIQASLTYKTLSTFYTHTTKNTYYYNFDPSPGFMIEYSYEYFNDGHFGVNIFGLENMEKGMCYETWAKFLYFHQA